MKTYKTTLPVLYHNVLVTLTTSQNCGDSTTQSRALWWKPAQSILTFAPSHI